MLRGMADDAGQQHRVRGQRDRLEDVILVLVPRVGRLEGEGAGLDRAA